MQQSDITKLKEIIVAKFLDGDIDRAFRDTLLEITNNLKEKPEYSAVDQNSVSFILANPDTIIIENTLHNYTLLKIAEWEDKFIREKGRWPTEKESGKITKKFEKSKRSSSNITRALNYEASFLTEDQSLWVKVELKKTNEVNEFSTINILKLIKKAKRNGAL